MWPSFKDNPLASVMVVIALLLLSVFLAMKAWNLSIERKFIGKPSGIRDTINIEGNGKISSKPTLAMLELGVFNEGENVADVQKENTQRVNAIIAAMRDMGVKADDIQTSNYNIQPRFDYRDGASRVNGYTITQSVSVKVRDLSRVGDVLGKAGQVGVNQVNGITFTIDEPASIQQEARKKALEDAKKKAEELAQSLGVEIVRVVSFSETPYSSLPMAPSYRADGMGGGGYVPPSIQSGSLDVTSNVVVTFEIR